MLFNVLINTVINCTLVIAFLLGFMADEYNDLALIGAIRYELKQLLHIDVDVLTPNVLAEAKPVGNRDHDHEWF